MSVANGYIISQANPLTNSKIIDAGKVNNLIKSGLNLLVGFLSIKQIGVVSAEETAIAGCCIKRDTDSLNCFDVWELKDNIDTECGKYGVATGENNIFSDVNAMNCEDLADDCKLGSCWTEGKCNANVRKGNCVEDGEFWSATDSTCSSAQAEVETGCCNEAKTIPSFMTRSNCRDIADDILNPDFTAGKSEFECIIDTNIQEEGACEITVGVIQTCNFKTKKECESANGQFWGGYLCSHSNFEYLSVEYKSKDHIGCVPGKDEIYWFDSQGNRENIYGTEYGRKDGVDDNSLNLVKIKENSCGDTGSNNIKSDDCGNCDNQLGSICAKKSEGTGSETPKDDLKGNKYICKSLNCPDAPDRFVWEDENKERVLKTEFRRHGESWCIYDSAIGDGKDTVGSEHRVASCLKGEVTVIECGEARSEVCEETVIEPEIVEYLDDGETEDKYESTAACASNREDLCAKANDKIREYEEDDEKKVDYSGVAEACGKQNHCTMRYVNVDKYFKFDMCVPKYPRGSEVMDDGYRTGASCLGANMPCIMVYVQDAGALVGEGNWDPKVNKKCAKGGNFEGEMNELCASMGDCGSYINYLGDATDNVHISGEEVDGDKKDVPPIPSGSGYVNFKNYEEYITNKALMEYINTTDSVELETLLGGIGSKTPSELEALESNREKDFWTKRNWEKGLGGLGLAGTISSMSYAAYLVLSLGSKAYAAQGFSSAFSTAMGGSIMGPWAFALIGAVLGGYTGYKIAQATGKTGPAVHSMIVAGATSGGGLGLLAYNAVAGLAMSGWGLGLAIAGAVILAWVAVSGWGDPKERKVSFSCEAWQAPIVSAKCEECQKYTNDGYKGIKCTEYKCESIGQNCEFINGDTDKPLCVGRPEIKIPKISFKSVDDKYKESGSDLLWEMNLTGGERITALTQDIEFVLKTTKPETDKPEYTTCKWTLTPSALTPRYNTMEEQYSESGEDFASEHKFIIDLPDIYGTNNLREVTDSLDKTGEVDMHIRCYNRLISNLAPFIIRFNIKSGPDIDIVDHTKTVFNPVDGSYIKLGTTSQNINMWINEPAECRYSYDGTEAYDVMAADTISCNKKIANGKVRDVARNIDGWPCSFSLTNFPSMENTIYIKCNDTVGNVNKQNLEYTIKNSTAELKIDSVQFETTINGKTTLVNSEKTITTGDTDYPLPFKVKVQTSGGVKNDGVARCEWAKLNEDGTLDSSYDYMQTTGANSHEQVLNSFDSNEGEITYKIRIRCFDNVPGIQNVLQGGNTDETDTIITIDKDNAEPEFPRAFKKGGSLRIETNEDAICYYDLNNCNFNLIDENKISPVFSTNHFVDWVRGQTYYIKCIDKWTNKNSGCTAYVAG